MVPRDADYGSSCGESILPRKEFLGHFGDSARWLYSMVPQGPELMGMIGAGLDPELRKIPAESQDEAEFPAREQKIVEPHLKRASMIKVSNCGEFKNTTGS